MSENARMALAAGTELGPYRIEAVIGAGGMGEVYRAHDGRLGRTVAVKVLPPAKAGDPGLRQRFEREARAIAAISHPHICALYDVGEHEGALYLVMELLEGETLGARLKRRAAASGSPRSGEAPASGSSVRAGLPLDQVLRFAIDIADALDRAHRAGVIHRDLKPDNVMLTKGGVKVVDFGLARIDPPTAEPGDAALRSALPTKATMLTKEATVLGTMPYMAPEQLEGRSVDARSDIFSFGALLYEMLVGRRAFTAQSEAALIASILEHDPEPPSQLRPGVPPALDRLVRVCLAKDPDERWQSAGDLKRELVWILEQGSRAAEGGVPAALVRRRRVRLALAGAGVVAITLVGMWLGFVMGQRAPRGSSAPHVSMRLQVAVASLNEPQDFALSPDGSRMALVQIDERNEAMLWLRPLDARAARALPGTEGAHLPFWSQDSRHVAFFTTGAIKRVDVETGEVRIVCSVSGTGWGGSWADDGTIVFAAYLDGLRVVSATGGTPRTVLAYEKPYTLLGRPEWLPDRRHVLLPLVGHFIEHKGIYVWPMDGTPGRLVLDGTSVALASADTVVYYRNGTLFGQRFDAGRAQPIGTPVVIADGVEKSHRGVPAAFSVSRNGTLALRTKARNREQFRFYDRQGHVVGTIGSESVYGNFDLSKTGTHVVTARQEGNEVNLNARSIWVLDGVRGGEVQVRPAANDEEIDNPAWLGGTSEFAFGINRSPAPGLPGKPRIIRQRVEGGSPEAVPLPVREGFAPFVQAVSPDGGSFAFTALRFADGRVTVLGGTAPLDGSSPPVYFGRDNVIIGQIQYAPTGKHLVFHDDSSGRTEVYVTTVPPSEKRWPISTAGGSQPRVRGDAREIYYVAPDGMVMAVDVKLGEHVEAGVPKPLFRVPGRFIDFADDRYAVTSDGQRFLVKTVIASAGDEPITVVTDWTAQLGAR